MAVLSLRIDDDLKKSLENEARKLNISLSDHIKTTLKNNLLDTHISNTENNLSNSKEQIKKLTEISNEAINEIEQKIKSLGENADKYNHVKQLRKIYCSLISASIFLGLILIPIAKFSIEYLTY